MKLIDVIKTENGRSYLGDNPKFLISPSHDRLNREVPGYDPKEEYEECEFSYKDFVRKFSKYESGITRLWRIMCELNGKGGITQRIAQVYMGCIYEFDGDFIEIEKNGEISFMPYNKIQVINQPGYRYEEKGRQRMSVFKFFKKIIPERTANEKQIQEFVDNMMAMVTMELRVEFVRGDDIGKIYNSVTMQEGWAKSSCMRGKTLNRFRLYCDNPEKCELGVIYNKDRVVGRFLRWKTDQLGWVEDVLYYASGMVKAWYDDRCQTEDIWWRVGRSHFQKGKEKYEKRLSLEMTKTFNSYGESRPYLDTMVAGDGKVISNGVGN